jgi:MFS transporter, DHA3 family, tetracycline resistance protein
MHRRNAYVVYLILETAISVAGGLYGTISAVYRVEAAGLNPLELVLVGTVLEAAYFLANLPTGVVADTYSRRLSVIIGLILYGIGFIIEGAIPLFATILLAQVIWGVGATFLDGAMEAWISGEIGDARVRQAFLRASQVGAVGGIVGAIASVLIAGIGLGLPMILGGVVYIALGAFAIFAMPENGFQRIPPEERTSSWQEFTSTLRHGGRVVRHSPLLLTILSIAFFAGMASEGFDRLWEAHFLTVIHLPALASLNPIVWFGIITVGAELLGIGTTEVIRRWVPTDTHVSAARVLFTINALLVAGVVVFGLAGSFPLAIGAYWTVSVLRGLRNPIYTAWLTQRIEPRVRATVLSMSSQLDSLGQVAGGPFIGLIGTVQGLRAALVFSGIALAPALPLFALARRQGRGLDVKEVVTEGITAAPEIPQPGGSHHDIVNDTPTL